MGRAKRVETFDLEGRQNGFLVELKKNGRKTESYLTAAYPGCFKGYHLHRVRESNYVCIRGKVDILLAKNGKIETHKLDCSGENKLHIPINVPVAINNIYLEEAWLINFPDPAYDPLLKFEQEDINPDEILKWLKENSK